LLGIAGTIWYFARQQTQTVTLSQEDVAASTPSFDETEAKLKEAQQAALKIDKKLDKMTKKIDEVLATAPTPEVTAPKVEVIEESAPVVEETYEISEEEFQTEVAAGSTDVVSEEVGDSKPVRKKKRRYYPKKK
jgi:TPP-dependent 2-oxoacid decarboxylase